MPPPVSGVLQEERTKNSAQRSRTWFCEEIILFVFLTVRLTFRSNQRHIWSSFQPLSFSFGFASNQSRASEHKSESAHCAGRAELFYTNVLTTFRTFYSSGILQSSEDEQPVESTNPSLGVYYPDKKTLLLNRMLSSPYLNSCMLYIIRARNQVPDSTW